MWNRKLSSTLRVGTDHSISFPGVHYRGAERDIEIKNEERVRYSFSNGDRHSQGNGIAAPEVCFRLDVSKSRWRWD